MTVGDLVGDTNQGAYNLELSKGDSSVVKLFRGGMDYISGLSQKLNDSLIGRCFEESCLEQGHDLKALGKYRSKNPVAILFCIYSSLAETAYRYYDLKRGYETVEPQRGVRRPKNIRPIF